MGQDAADSALRGQTGLFPEISVYFPMADTLSLLLTSRTTSRVMPLKILTDPSWGAATKEVEINILRRTLYFKTLRNVILF